MIKKWIILLLSLLVLPVIYPVQKGEIAYKEGSVKIKNQANQWQEPDFGDTIESGSTIVTGANGYVEITSDSHTIKINRNTVFTFMETELNNKPRSAFTCITGSVAFKISKITGTAPEINTLAANAGVRGTEFSLFAADNGATLVVVSEGAVDVSASGGSVVLSVNEGVEVKPGSPPGEKFTVLRGMLDFKSWNEGKLKEFLADPVAAVYGLYAELEGFSKEIEKLKLVFDAGKKLLDLERKNLDEILKKEGKEAANSYYVKKVLPLETETSYRFLNIRYYSLSALSLRRYVLSRLYLLMKINYQENVLDQKYKDYLYAHNQALQFFENRITPFLVEADF